MKQNYTEFIVRVYHGKYIKLPYRIKDFKTLLPAKDDRGEGKITVKKHKRELFPILNKRQVGHLYKQGVIKK